LIPPPHNNKNTFVKPFREINPSPQTPPPLYHIGLKGQGGGVGVGSSNIDNYLKFI